jgi:hypothetical protein
MCLPLWWAEDKYMLRVNLRKGSALRARFMSDLKVRPPKNRKP